VWTPQDLLAAVQAGSAPVILDVRSRREFASGHVPGARHIPFWLLPARAADLTVARDSPIVVYCGHGPRAWFARAVLQAAGYSTVALMEGHMSAWKRAGFPEDAG
jgi:rhodanese-related sulfurtransferase